MRVRVNSWKSSIGSALISSDTTLAGLNVGTVTLPTIASPDFLTIILDPHGVAGVPEIVHLTTYTSGNASGTISRGQESSTARAHASGVAMIVGPTIADFFVGSFAVDVGDGSSTSITVTHNLGTKDVIVSVYDKTTPFQDLVVDVRRTTTNTVTLIFGVAPTSAQFRCVVHA